jgi:hypothetical protein
MCLQNNGIEYKYNQEVTYTLSATNLNEYRSVAEQINERKDIGLVCIQHEFGLLVVNMAIISLLLYWP